MLVLTMSWQKNIRNTMTVKKYARISCCWDEKKKIREKTRKQIKLFRRNTVGNLNPSREQRNAAKKSVKGEK